LRLMLKLRAAEVGRHKLLLLSVAQLRPQLAARYVAALPFSLEPRLSLRWLAAASLLVELAPRVQRHLLGSLTSALPAPGAPSAAAGLAPPPADGAAVRALLKAVVPPSVTKAGLSRGLQHSSLLVRHLYSQCNVGCLFVGFRVLFSVSNAIGSAGGVVGSSE
jgi:nucleolar pre-ribosomal-associated protein 1